MRESFDTFRTLINRYPNSTYAEDAHYRLAYLINAMANNELHVARYYFKRGAFLAAANRAQQAIRAYPEAPAVEQALEMLITSYEKLGLDDLRGDALKVLALNYPEHPLVKPKADEAAR
jgi:outer membrane protein assembly factor BamD